MPDLLPSNRWKDSIGKQSAEGTPQTTQDYQIPVYASSLKAMESREDLSVIQGDSYVPGQFKTKAWGEGTVEWAMFPDSIGRLLTAHLGLDTKTGAGDPWTHTITQNATPQWCTLYVARPLTGGTYEYDQFADAHLKTCDIVYAAGTMPRAVTEIIAKKVTTKATSPTITVTNTLDVTGTNYSWVAPTFKMDLDATPATTTTAMLQSFTFHMGYDSADMLNTVALNPDYWDPGLWTCAFNGSFLMANWDAYYTSGFGTRTPGANTAQSAVIVRGSADVTLNLLPVNANRTLQIQMPAIEMMIEAPEPSADGKGLTVSMAGALQKPPSGEPITFVLKNGVTAAN